MSSEEDSDPIRAPTRRSSTQQAAESTCEEESQPIARPGRQSATQQSQVVQSSSEEDSQPITGPGRQSTTQPAQTLSEDDLKIISSPGRPKEQQSTQSKKFVPIDIIDISSDESEAPRLKRNVVQPSQKSQIGESGQHSQLKKPKTTLQIEEGHDPDMKNLDKFIKARDNVYVKAGANVDYSLELSAASQRLQRFVTGPKYGRRDVRLKKWSNELSRDTYRLTFVSDPTDDSFAKRINIPIPTTSYSQKEAESVCDQLIAILNRLPCILTDKVVGSRRCQQLLLNVATETALPGHTLVRRLVGFANPNKNKGVYQTSILYFDEPSFEPTQYFLTVPVPDDSSMLERIPKVPDTVKFLRSEGKSKPVPIPDDAELRKCHETSIALSKFLSWKMTGVVGTKASMDELVSAYQEQFGVRQARRNGLKFYKGRRMFVIEYSSHKFAKSGRVYTKGRRGPGRCVISASKYVKKDVVGTLPDIVIKTGILSRSHHVTKTMHEVWVATQDIKATWEAGCRAGDRVNRGSHEESLGTVCACDEKISKSTSHLCDHCDTPTLCCDLSWRNIHVRWCPACEQNWEDEVRDTELNPSLRRMKAAIRLLLFSESKLAGREYDPALFEECVKALRPQAHDLKSYEWCDAYSTNLRIDIEPLKLRKGRYVYPFLPSIDAALPYSEWKGSYYVHCPDNVVFTAWYLNAAKHTFVPSTLTLVSEYYASPMSSADKKSLIEKTDVVHEIGVKTPHRKAARVNAPFDPQKLQEDRSEWVGTILKPSKNAPWKANEYRYTSGGWGRFEDTEWKPKGYSRLLKLVDQIEKYFDRELPRKNDRLDRMREWCNGKWETVDTIETIYLECVWQVLDPDFGDLFGLPMTIWMRHPLRFAIAHLFHGKQMQTGWLVEEPSYITDHDATVNNISIETCFTNYAKSNIPNDRYPELQNDIKAVTVGKKWHVRSSKEGTRASAEAGADLEEFEDEDVSDWDDQLAGQDFIDDEDDDDESDKEEAGAEKADDDEVPQAGPSKPKAKSSKAPSQGLAIDKAAIDEDATADAGEIVDDERVEDYRAAFVARNEDDAPLAAGEDASAAVHTYIVQQLQARLQELLDGNQNVVERVIIRRILNEYGETPVG